jgi:hypothetical protein
MEIKQTKELIKGLELLGVVGKKIAKDNKIGVDDIVHLIHLGQNMDVLVAAFSGLQDIKAELSNLSQDEVLEIIGALYAAADAINKA